MFNNNNKILYKNISSICTEEYASNPYNNRFIIEEYIFYEILGSYFKNSFSKCSCAIFYDEKIWIGLDSSSISYLGLILKIYDINNPEKVLTLRIEENSDNTYGLINFNIYVRHNRIYIYTYKKFQIYDFEANLLFNFTDSLDEQIPWFYVDKYNKNKIYISNISLFNDNITKKRNYGICRIWRHDGSYFI